MISQLEDVLADYVSELLSVSRRHVAFFSWAGSRLEITSFMDFHVNMGRCMLAEDGIYSSYRKLHQAHALKAQAKSQGT